MSPILPPRGSIPTASWLATIAMAAAMLFASRSAAPALLPLAGSLLGATHPPPTGPLGAACFLLAVASRELSRRAAAPDDRSRPAR